MKRIKGFYLVETDEDRERFGGSYSTGLVFETEDGRFFRMQSTDFIMPFEEIEALNN